jgi:hypothetical protein
MAKEEKELKDGIEAAAGKLNVGSGAAAGAGNAMGICIGIGIGIGIGAGAGIAMRRGAMALLRAIGSHSQVMRHPLALLMAVHLQ